MANSKSRGKRRLFKQNTIAVVYDFDGTLVPKPMQEYTILPNLNVKSKTFWKKVKTETLKYQADQIVTYMRLLLDEVEVNKAHITRDTLRQQAKKIEYFPGVEDWFDRINDYVKEKSKRIVKIRHYIISAGLKEILEGISIKKHFHRMYACEYFFDHHNIPKFPTVVINDTTKTQYLFRINKGREKVTDPINEYMPEENRPIPFENIIYIGDGLTDVPCMTLTKKGGGHAVAVYTPNSPKGLSVCKELAKANRIDFFAPADYSSGKKLEVRIKLMIDVIMSKILFEKEKFAFQQQLDS